MLLSTLAALAEPRFATELNRESVVLGEQVELTLKFEGGSPKSVTPLPQINGLQVASGSKTGFTSTQEADGSMTSVQTYTLTLIPQRAGEFTIPALKADVEGYKLQTQPLKLTVLASDPNAPPVEYANQIAFLWLVLPKKEVYVGEVVLAELRLYLRGDVQGFRDPQIPPLSGEGFTASRSVQGQQFSRRVGNNDYAIIPIQVALTPVKTGPLTIGPLNGTVVVHLPAAQPRNPSVFDLLRPQTDARRVALNLAEQKLNVLPWPTQNVPPNFNGAVGNYSIKFNASPTNVAAGDPITVKVQITGRGALEALALPDQPQWSEFKAYPPTAKLDTTDEFKLQGTKTFEQVLIPQSADIKSIPPFSFSFFDPDQKVYRTVKEGPLSLIVRPSGSAPTPMVATRRPDDTPATKDIVQIKHRLGAVAQVSPPLIQQPWFIGLQTLPMFAFLAAFVWRKRADSLANNPRLRRQRQVAQLVRDGLNDLRRLAGENNSDQFFATLFHLLQEQIGARLDLPASAITEAVIDEPRFVKLGLSEDALRGLRELFQTCNLARYAPVKNSQELAAVIPKFEAVIRELQNANA